MDELEHIKAEAIRTLLDRKTWLERHLVWFIAGGCLALGIIIRSLW